MIGDDRADKGALWSDRPPVAIMSWMSIDGRRRASRSKSRPRSRLSSGSSLLPFCKRTLYPSSAAANVATRGEGRGDIFVYADPDVEPDPNAVVEMLEVLERDSELMGD